MSEHGDNYKELGEYRLSLIRTLNSIDLSVLRISDSEIYDLLIEDVLNRNVYKRDISLDPDDKIKQLVLYDEICPDYLNKIKGFRAIEFLQSEFYDKFIFGALHGVDYRNIEDYNNDDEVFLFTCYSIFIKYYRLNHKIDLKFLLNLAEDNVLRLLMHNTQIDTSLIKFLNDGDMRRALHDNILNHIPYATISQYNERYNLLTTHKYSTTLLKRLYSIYDTREWTNQVKKKPHYLEEIILNLNNNTLPEAVNKIGMIIPLSYKNNPLLYVENNILSYTSIFNRNLILPRNIDMLKSLRDEEARYAIEKMSDQEIFNLFKIYVPYENKERLNRNILKTLSRQGFIYPIERSTKHCLNIETLSGSSIFDTSVMLIAYGTVTNYRFYELDDLINAFYYSDETRCIEFRKPENLKDFFSIEDIEFLQFMLQSFPLAEDINRLLTVIDEGLTEKRDQLEFDKHNKREFDNFDAKQQRLIYECLYQIFYTGMYMRKWLGPPNPYPMKELETQKDNYDPNDKVTEELKKIGTMLESMHRLSKFMILDMKLCQYNSDGTIEHGNLLFSSEIEQVTLGKKCIRMASSCFIGTAYHYIKLFFDEKIEGLNIKSLDHIT